MRSNELTDQVLYLAAAGQVHVHEEARAADRSNVFWIAGKMVLVPLGEVPGQGSKVCRARVKSRGLGLTHIQRESGQSK
jgi:hypothetical protein